MIRTRRLVGLAAVGCLTVGPVNGQAQNLETVLTNNYGNPGGLIDMPTAEVAPDAQIATSVMYFDGFTRTSLNLACPH